MINYQGISWVPVIDDDTVGELQMFGATELVENISKLIKDDHSHHLNIVDSYSNVQH